MADTFDVAVVGAGLVGAAVAFDLNRIGLKVVVLEAERETCAGVSRTNSGMLHTGFDSKPGVLETRMIQRQSERWPRLFDTLKIPYRRIGALLLAKTAEEEAKLPRIVEQAKQNGVEVQLLGKTQTLERSAGAPATAGVLVPGETITDPYEVVRGLLHGLEVRLGWKVTALEADREGVKVFSGDEAIVARHVINCGGLFADELLDDGFEVTPRRGDFIVYPKNTVPGLGHVLLPVPNEFTKGVLIFPTLYGYLCAGPTAEDVRDKRDWNPRPEGVALLHEKARAVLPALAEERPISAWAGLRTVGHPENYLIRWSPSLEGVLHVAGIRSTGLSACLGISEYVVQLLKERGVNGQTPRAVEPAPPAEARPWWERHNAYHDVTVP